MAFKLLSYNTTGLSEQTSLFIQELLQNENPDMLLLQEIWQIKSTPHKLGDIHNDYLWHGVCGMDDKEWKLSGCPSGGMAI